VLGDMLELGENSVQLHEELGSQAAGVADVLIGVGRFSQDLCRGAKVAGLKSEQMIAVADAAAAIKYLNQHRQSGDLVLLKGSRGIHLERVADTLKTAVDNSLNETKGN